jgi:hypothetical protein
LMNIRYARSCRSTQDTRLSVRPRTEQTTTRARDTGYRGSPTGTHARPPARRPWYRAAVSAPTGHHQCQADHAHRQRREGVPEPPPRAGAERGHPERQNVAYHSPRPHRAPPEATASDSAGACRSLDGRRNRANTHLRPGGFPHALAPPTDRQRRRRPGRHVAAHSHSCRPTRRAGRACRPPGCAGLGLRALETPMAHPSIGEHRWTRVEGYPRGDYSAAEVDTPKGPNRPRRPREEYRCRRQLGVGQPRHHDRGTDITA